MVSIVGPHRILVVDDHEYFRQLVTTFLGERGYNVLQAANGATAIKTAITSDPKLILLDLHLPDMHGVQVAGILRTTPQTLHIPIIGWTAAPVSKPFHERLLRAGFRDCLPKTVSPRELAAAIDQCALKTR